MYIAFVALGMVFWHTTLHYYTPTVQDIRDDAQGGVDLQYHKIMDEAKREPSDLQRGPWARASVT